MVYAEYARNAVNDISVKAAYRRADDNHRSDANDDPNQCQKCSEFMRPDGPKSNPERFGVKRVSVFHI
jgi:hypothetical protein